MYVVVFAYWWILGFRFDPNHFEYPEKCVCFHRVIIEVAASPLLNMVSTTASTFLAVEIPTLE